MGNKKRSAVLILAGVVMGFVIACLTIKSRDNALAPAAG